MLVKVKIKKAFRDKDTFKMYEVDSTVDFSEERVKSIKEKLGNDVVEVEKPEQKKPKTTRTTTKKPVKKQSPKKSE